MDARIDPDILWSNLKDLGAIGSSGRGVTRLAFSREDMEGRLWLVSKMKEAGLRTRVDSVGNVFGLLGGDSRAAKKMLVGSHLDTVPEGGRFDGALGVLSALECARTIRQAGVTLRHPLEVVAFANEEGSRIGPGTFGSRFLTGNASAQEVERARNLANQAGFLELAKAADSVDDIPITNENYAASLELHIEQGGVLDSTGESIGLVEGIVCIQSFTVNFKGKANHAGTTPMAGRRDALQGAAELILKVPRLVAELGSGITVGTCGRLEVRPGGRNVIPGEAAVSVEVRDLDERAAGRVLQAVAEYARRIGMERGLTVEIYDWSNTPGALMDHSIMGAIRCACEAEGLSYRQMPSGAGHDSMITARVIPAGMIFVPSQGGISHSPDESTSPLDCANGARVLLGAILRVDRLF